ncbi:suppressor of cytokine signaling 1b [Aulostomus maculatus]
MVQVVASRRIFHGRMVRDNPDGANSPKENSSAETQNQSQTSEKPEEPERAPSPQRPKAKSKEPTERESGLLFWKKFQISEEELETWCLPVNGTDAGSFPTHFRPFRSIEEYKLVRETHQQLQHSGYYWGPMTMEEAHKTLSHTPLGTFLIRDSGQPDIFFTLSYQSDDFPTSVRVVLSNLNFSLYGSHKTFASLFALLAYYSSSSCKLTAPYRKQRPERLKQICRRALIQTLGAGKLNDLHGLSSELKDYIHAYPHSV